MMEYPVNQQPNPAAPPSTLFSKQMELLKLQLTLIDNAIRQLDEITKSVKNWAIVAWTGSVGIALATPELRPYLGLSGILPLLFWVVDGSYRRVQRTFIVRVSQISEYINGAEFKRCAATETAMDFALLEMRVKKGPRTRLDCRRSSYSEPSATFT
jgi:hypothetical protein